MPSTKQVIALLSSHVEGDDEQFLSVALQVAAAEARRGHGRVSDELKRLVDKARHNQTKKQQTKTSNQTKTVSFSRPRGELESLVNVSEPHIQFENMALEEDVYSRLNKFAHQQIQRGKLRQHGVTPKTRLLFVGPPGSGKTMTASAIAGELHLPLYTVRLDALITRYMGETSTKLRTVFDEICSRRGVYLFDEFDAIGGKRSDANDVGEMRRVLNSFLQFLEEPNSTDSVIIAATNHPELLDRALLRRFDDIISYSLPDERAIKSILSEVLSSFKKTRLSWSDIFEAAIGLSHAELSQAAKEIAKDAILSDKERIDTGSILHALVERREMRDTMSKILD